MDDLTRQPSVAAPTAPPRAAGLCCTAALVVVVGLTGCGQKGPLTLPPPATAASAPAAAK